MMDSPMMPDDMIDVRKAALLVHSLPLNTRVTVLGQLTESQRQHIDGMLEELRTIGVPTERDWLKYFEDGPIATGYDPVLIRNLNLAGVDHLLHVFEQQPPEVVTAVIAAAPWTWRTDVLEALPVHQRIAVNALLNDNRKLANAVTQRLLSLCLDAVRAVSVQAQPDLSVRKTSGRRSWTDVFF